MAVSRREALARRGRATYQDVLDAPAHLVAEIVDGRKHHVNSERRPSRGADEGICCGFTGTPRGDVVSEPIRLDRQAAEIVVAFLRAHGYPAAEVEQRKGDFVVRVEPGRYVGITTADKEPI